MKIISHRGNINGSIPKMENKPEYIINAINLGFDVEVDLWIVNDELFLGHDYPQYKINFDYLNNISKKIWIHAKNIDALYFLLKTKLNFFWHQNDHFTLTSNNYIWTYPDQPITNKSIIVCLNYVKMNQIPYGICTDYPSKYQLID